MKLVPLMKIHVLVASPFDIGDTTHGKRLVANITGGAFEGKRLTGTVCSSGADWISNIMKSSSPRRSAAEKRKLATRIF